MAIRKWGGFEWEKDESPPEELQQKWAEDALGLSEEPVGEPKPASFWESLSDKGGLQTRLKNSIDSLMGEREIRNKQARLLPRGHPDRRFYVVGDSRKQVYFKNFDKIYPKIVKKFGGKRVQKYTTAIGSKKLEEGFLVQYTYTYAKAPVLKVSEKESVLKLVERIVAKTRGRVINLNEFSQFSQIRPEELTRSSKRVYRRYEEKYKVSKQY